MGPQFQTNLGNTMTEDIAKLYSPVIRDHANQPRNCRRLLSANFRASSKNPLCGDCITVFLRVEDGIVREVSFESFGCALCRASASLLSEAAQGLTWQGVCELGRAVEAMATQGRTSSLCQGELLALGGVHPFPARIPCVLLPWQTVLEAFDPKPSC
ncbi:MAG: NifU-like protein [Verrucomicrobia bacterium ADurb.Bin006]|nr:MAG: NifU-like protein [Verrucomicrobia bacterium ADurb.Bin006]